MGENRIGKVATIATSAPGPVPISELPRAGSGWTFEHAPPGTLVRCTNSGEHFVVRGWHLHLGRRLFVSVWRPSLIQVECTEPVA